MNTKLLHRLAWKELRSLRALWLSLLGMALFVQMCSALIDNRHGDRVTLLFGAALWLPVVFSLVCGAIAFAGEREEGTDQLLCRLAGPPLALWCVKFTVIVLCTVVMFVIVYPVAWIGSGVDERVWAHNPYVVTELSGFRQADGGVGQMHGLAIFWGVCLLSWGMFFSLLLRRVLPCLIVSVLATMLTHWGVAWLVTLSPNHQPGFCTVECLLQMGLLPGLVPLLASVWLVQTWDEDRWPRLIEWSVGFARRMSRLRLRVAGTGGEAISLVPESLRIEVGSRAGIASVVRAMLRRIGFCWPDEWLPAWRREARRLLWLEWRQAWRVMLFVLAGFGVYIACQRLFVAWGSVLVAKEFPFVMALVSFVFGAWSFQAQQSGQRFRGFAGHGASPAAMWCIKQGVWFAVTLLTMVIVASIAAWFSGGRHFVYWEPDHESLWRRLGYGLSSGELAHWNRHPQLQSESLGGVVSSSVLAVGLCFGVGQLVSLLVTRAVTAATIGFVLAALAFGWQQLTALAAIPPGLAVLPLIVGLLLASAVRMTDWLEERNSVRGWLRVIAAGVVPSLVTLVGVPVYRVVEVPSVISADFYWHDFRHLTTDVASPDAKQTAQRWMRLAESLSSQATFRRNVLVFPNAVTGVIEQEQWTVPGFSDIHHGYVSWDTLNDRQWLALNVKQVSEAARIAQQLDCAFDREFFHGDFEQERLPERHLTQLAVLLKMAAESALSEGKLDESLQHGLVLLRLSEHMQQHAQFWQAHNGERLEVATWRFLIQWALHPAQSGNSLRAALGRSANAAPHPLLEALQKHVELLPPPSEVVVEEFADANQELAKDWRVVGWPTSWMFWERHREERVLNYSTATSMEALRHWINDSRESWEGHARLVTRSRVEHHPPTRKQTLAAFWLDSTRNPNADRYHHFVWRGEYTSDDQRANERAEASAWRRGLVATLALRAFQLDHGRWPTQWDELIGPYLDRVPVDPWNGLPFELRPQGYPFEVKILGSHIPAHTPLFVSRGQYDQQLVPVVRPSATDETATTMEWFSVCPIERDPQPLKDSTRTLSLIAFPLSVTER